MLTPGFSGDLCSGYPLHPRLSILESSIGLPYQATDRLCQTIQIPVQYSSRSHSDMGSCINLDGCSSLQSLGSWLPNTTAQCSDLVCSLVLLKLIYS